MKLAVFRYSPASPTKWQYTEVLTVRKGYRIYEAIPSNELLLYNSLGNSLQLYTWNGTSLTKYDRSIPSTFEGLLYNFYDHSSHKLYFILWTYVGESLICSHSHPSWTTHKLFYNSQRHDVRFFHILETENTLFAITEKNGQTYMCLVYDIVTQTANFQADLCVQENLTFTNI
jgi:hypothetical protein